MNMVMNSGGEMVDGTDPGYWEWLQTFSGNKFYAKQPTAESFSILDIAHGLALECRYGGQTDEFYSVAQHSVLVSLIVANVLKRPDLALEGLLHDGAEGLGLKDIPRPVKVALGAVYKDMETTVERCIAAKWQLQYPFDPVIKTADNIALMTERRDLFRCINKDWQQKVDPLKEKLVPMPWQEAETVFLARFYALLRDRGAR